MKQLLFILTILLSVSFVKKEKALLSSYDSYGRVYKTERYFGHRFFYGTMAADTLVFISKDKAVPANITQVPFYIDTVGLKEVQWLVHKEDTLYFTYFSKPFLCCEFKGRALVSSGAPGSHKMDMNTFSGYPLLIEDPKSFKSKTKN